VNRGTQQIERDNCSLPGKTASVPDRQGFDFTLANATRTWYMTRRELVQDCVQSREHHRTPHTSPPSSRSRWQIMLTVRHKTRNHRYTCRSNLWRNLRNKQMDWRAQPVSSGWGLNIEFEHGFGGKLKLLIWGGSERCLPYNRVAGSAPAYRISILDDPAYSQNAGVKWK